MPRLHSCRATHDSQHAVHPSRINPRLACVHTTLASTPSTHPFAARVHVRLESTCGSHPPAARGHLRLASTCSSHPPAARVYLQLTSTCGSRPPPSRIRLRWEWDSPSPTRDARVPLSPVDTVGLATASGIRVHSPISQLSAKLLATIAAVLDLRATAQTNFQNVELISLRRNEIP
ncbi:hypothetical protein C8R44DRAFT_746347 [Mycena epipterygia]|nr:hypothetical protein C8R44DRAFT_746347 [Mycena epipterygia]